MLKHLIAAAVLASAPAIVAPALACDGEDKVHTASIGSVTVDQLAQQLGPTKKVAAKVAIFDANTDKTRAEKGIIPTAVLLPSSSDYDLALLPKDKSGEVVFYCAAEKCSASTTAAKRAVEAGYTKVSVLPEGIAGWVKAGKATQKVSTKDVKAVKDVKELPAQG
jgi:rhodanese-related sulfurtransferase